MHALLRRMKSHLEKRQDEFLKKVKEKHGDRYMIYPKEYVNARSRINVHCTKHKSTANFIARSLTERETVCKQCYNEKYSSGKDNFLEKARLIHGDRYDYKKVEYISTIIPVTIICKKHGEFKQRPANHLRGQNCIECIRDEQRKPENIQNLANKTVDKTLGMKFIEKASIRHNNYYNYSLVKYVHSNIPVEIICPIHGIFKQTPHTHLRSDNFGCKKCAYNVTRGKLFIEKAKKVHGNKYDYSGIDLSKPVIKIKCKDHNVYFEQEKRNHLRYTGCPKCITEMYSMTTDEFINRIKDLYEDRYTFEKTHYVNNETPVIITCKYHGEFKKLPFDILRKRGGCQECTQSDIEIRVKKLFCKNDIDFVEQYKIYGYDYRYDFYIEKANLLVEIDDISHINSKVTIRRDKNKTKLAKEKNMLLVRLPHNEFSDLENMLTNRISKHYPYIVNGTLLENEKKLREYLRIDDAKSLNTEHYKLNLL